MIVLVTGATAGFGECITRRFIQQGHKVIATGRRQERLQELKTNWEIIFISPNWTFATAPLLKRCWHRFLPSGAILISW